MDVLTFSFMALMALAFFDCLIRFLSYCAFGDVRSNLACFLIGLAVFAAVLFFLRGRIKLYAPAFNKIDIVFILVYAIYFLVKSIIPDSMADTQTAEIFYQEFSFSSKLEALKPNLPFYAGWSTLGSRVFYYSRLILGFRLSVLPNLFIIITAFFKTKEILTGFCKDIFPTPTKLKRHAAASLLSGAAFLILCDEFILIGAVIIKPDLFVLPLLLECLRLVFLTERRDLPVYILIGFFTGISIANKLTNIIYFLPFIACIVCLDARKKTFKPKKLLWSLAAMILPVAPFALYNWLFIGNPIFPFLNDIFQSPNYPLKHFSDTRWGPEGFLEALAWPFIVVFNTSRFGEVIDQVSISNGRLAIGCITAAVSCFVYTRNGLLKKRLPLMLYMPVAAFLWSAASGYVRYGMVLGVLAFVLLAVFVMDMLALHTRILIAVFAPLAAVSLAISFLFITYYNFDWSWRPSIIFRGEETLQNLPRIMKDYSATSDKELQARFDAVKTWVCAGNVTIDAVLANPKAEFFISRGRDDPASVARRYFGANSADGLYALTRHLEDWLLAEYTEYGFYVEEIEEVFLNHMDINEIAYFIKLAYNPV